MTPTLAITKSSDLGLAHSEGRSAGSPVGGLSDLVMDDHTFGLLAAMIYGAVGIRLDVRKKSLLSSRLAKRLRKLALGSYREYYGVVKDDERERLEMINCIATNTTSFFREPHHFEHLSSVVIPSLAQAGKREVRLWSAGCSTGEEPYSIAITVCMAIEQLGEAVSAWDIKVLATDISTKALETARAGVYDYSDCLPRTAYRYFLKGVNHAEGRMLVKDAVHGMVRFGRLNLMDDRYPFKRTFDAIFCRNVMIYFDDATRRALIGRLGRHLDDAGHLFLGHSETMLNTDQFASVGVTVYRKI